MIIVLAALAVIAVLAVIACACERWRRSMISLNLNPELKPVPQPAYIEIVGGFTKRSWELNEWNLRGIGEFTRENIQRWLERRYATSRPDPMASDILGDFHAVCGDINIPWATEDSKSIYETGYDTQGHKRNIFEPVVGFNPMA
jgi:hypothetical protein